MVARAGRLTTDLWSSAIARTYPSAGPAVSARSCRGRFGGLAMKSSALIPFVVVVAAYSAQAAESSYQKDPTEPPVSHFQGSCESDPDGTKFAEKACYTTYYPGKQGFEKGYRPPVCNKKPVTK